MLNGDILSDLDVSGLEAAVPGEAVLALRARPRGPREVFVDSDERVRCFDEGFSPRVPGCRGELHFTGLHALDPRLLRGLSSRPGVWCGSAISSDSPREAGGCTRASGRTSAPRRTTSGFSWALGGRQPAAAAGSWPRARAGRLWWETSRETSAWPPGLRLLPPVWIGSDVKLERGAADRSQGHPGEGIGSVVEAGVRLRRRGGLGWRAGETGL